MEKIGRFVFNIAVLVEISDFYTKKHCVSGR